MMRYEAMLGLSLLAAPLCADWKVTTVKTGDGSRSIQTDYCKDGMHRSDWLHYASVFDPIRSRYLAWDTQKREYSVQMLRAGLAVRESGPTIVIDVDSRDTGERRRMFGREVRHVITIERSHTERGSIESESHTDGWYFESDLLPPGIRNGTAVLTAGSPPIKINQLGIVEKGLPISTTRTTVSTMSNGERRTWENNSEVTQLFEGQLDTVLFEVPPGFHRVFHFDTSVAMAWPERLQVHWEWLQEWFAGLLR